MQIYLPIAEMSANIFILLSIGGVTGILSGMLGVGGGFLVTPLLMFIGVPPPVAVSSSANQIIGSSFSGFLAHWRRKNVDFLMGTLLTLGGFVGAFFGVKIFALLKSLGQIDLTISLIYVCFLGTIGLLMGIESVKAIFHQRRGITKDKSAPWATKIRLPFTYYFPKSDVEVSIIFPLLVGGLVGILVSLTGIGGGFVMIPAMIYIMGIPTSVVIGTSLFQITFITAAVTFLQSLNTKTVDIVLAILILSSAVIGAQIGSQIGRKLPAEYLRVMLALLVLLVVIRLIIGLVITPDNPFEVIRLER